MLLEKNDKLLFIGDSISDYDRARPVGEGLFKAWGTSYVADVGSLLCCMYPELNLRIVNMGHQRQSDPGSGSPLADGRAGSEAGFR